MSDETLPAPPRPTDPDQTAAAAPTSPGPESGPHGETLRQTPDQAARVAGALPPVSRVAVPGYELLAELGRGGMGVVYKARQVKLNRVVALKMILAGGHADPRELVRFVTEAQAVAAIRHPNVIQIFDSGEADGHPYMAMECVEGGSLAQRLKATGKLSPPAAAELVMKVAAGVQAAHDRGIVHRDLKPHNVLLDGPTATSPGEPKVMDFGLAKRAGADLTQTGAVMGTPAYMSPEQAKGDTRAVGPAADVYALGVILYECLTGSVPFAGADAWSVIRQVIADEPEPPARRAPGVPRDLDLICQKCMAKEPGERYATAAALADDLRRFLAGEPLLGPNTGVWYTVRKRARRHGRPILLGATILGLVVAAWFLPSPGELFGRKKPDPPGGEARKSDPVSELLRAEVRNQVEALRLTDPAPDRVCPHPLTVLKELPDTDYSKFKVFKDERVVDLRGWKPLDPADPRAECAIVYFTRREMMKVAPADELRVETRTTGRDVINRAGRPNGEKARALATDRPGFVGGQAMKVRQLAFDLADIPVRQEFTLRYTSTYWNSLQTPDEQWFGVIGYEGSVKASMLVLFPDGRPFREHRFRFGPTNAPRGTEPEPYTGPLITFAGDDNSWVYWEVPNPKPHTVYRIDWTW